MAPYKKTDKKSGPFAKNIKKGANKRKSKKSSKLLKGEIEEKKRKVSGGIQLQNGSWNDESLGGKLPVYEIKQIIETVPHGSKKNNKENLLFKSLFDHTRIHWLMGEWNRLVQLKLEDFNDNIDRAEIALLIGASHFQIGDTTKAWIFIHLAREWGCSSETISSILACGAYKNLARAASHIGDQSRVLKNISKSLEIENSGFENERTNQSLNSAVLKGAELGVFIENKPEESFYNSEAEIENVKKGDGEFSSAEYWDERYQKNGTSGFGSYGRLADFKAKTINDFISNEGIKSAIEMGCGDGNQLSLFKFETYIGVDVSHSVISHCRSRFAEHGTKRFYTSDEFLKKPEKADVTLSIDVLFHLIEDRVYDEYMETLFMCAEKYCIIYACDQFPVSHDPIHVKRRKITEWIAANIQGWSLRQIIFNKYPHDGSKNPKDHSFCDFYFYEKTATAV
jgi:hypothetical protein